VHEVDGHKLDSSEPTVDAPDKLVDCGPQVLILFDILTGWNSELDKNNLHTALVVCIISDDP
jgi:hypothetical protein